MFDIGFLELMVIAVLGLVVIGPEKLPSTIRTVAIWIGTVRRTLGNARAEFEKQIGADEIRRELHNEQVLASLRAAKASRDAIQNKLENLASETRKSAESNSEESIAPPTPEPSPVDPPAGADKPNKSE